MRVPELERVVVVLGASADQVLERVDFGRAEPVVCEHVRARARPRRCDAGWRRCEGAEKVVVTLGDAPLITPAVIARFAGEPGGTRALYDGRPGHPVVLGAEQMPRAGVAVAATAAHAMLLRGARTIECGALCSGRDVDTPDDLEAIRNEARAVI